MADFDNSALLASLAASNSLLAASKAGSGGGGGGKQGPLDGPINKGSQSLTAANMAAGLKMPSVIPTTGRGFFGSGGEKVGGLLGQIFEDIKKMSFPVQQASITDITGQSHGLGGGGMHGEGGHVANLMHSGHHSSGHSFDP